MIYHFLVLMEIGIVALLFAISPVLLIAYALWGYYLYEKRLSNVY